jgi:hypothetical protein
MSPPATHVPGQRADPASADTAPPPGKLSLSVAAASTATANGRGRRVSCSVALAVAGALAVVGLGLVFGLNMLNGDEKGSEAADKAPSARSSPSEGDQDSEPQDGAGDLPEKYLGTWEGDGYALGGNLPAGTFTITLEQGSVGDRLGTFRSVDLLGGACDDTFVLKKVTEDHVVVTSIADAKNNPKTCTSNTHEVTLTPVGDELQYTADNADAGDPTARLAKTKR